MGNEKQKPLSLSQKFLANCKATATKPKTHWCALPSELRRMILRNKSLHTYGRIFEAIWLRTVGKHGLGSSEIKTSQREIAEESGTSASDVSRLLGALKECGLGDYQKDWPSLLRINPAMLEPSTLLLFFRAIAFVLNYERNEKEGTEFGTHSFGKAVRRMMDNPTYLQEPEAAQ